MLRELHLEVHLVDSSVQHAVMDIEDVALELMELN